MANSVVSFEEALASIDVAHLINLNTSLIYEDVGITMMEYVYFMKIMKTTSCAVVKVNESSQKNFIETLLKQTSLRKMLNGNASGKGLEARRGLPHFVHRRNQRAKGGPAVLRERRPHHGRRQVPEADRAQDVPVDVRLDAVEPQLAGCHGARQRLLCHAHFVQLVMDLLPATCVLKGHCHLHQVVYNVVGKLST
mmetsp:Transcript_50459/g.74070  ORF Transcript_50459/g.74070 Transcript_50459/m.74070 type:complete len:195 (+) Transcript_50459:606-1190(+)